MKKLFALLLCLCMVFSFMSFAAAEEKVNLTAIQYALENQQTDFNNLWFFQQVEENAFHPRKVLAAMPTGKPRPT